MKWSIIVYIFLLILPTFISHTVALAIASLGVRVGSSVHTVAYVGSQARHRPRTQLSDKLNRYVNDFGRSSRPTALVTNGLIAANIAVYAATLAWPQLQYALMKIDSRIGRGETYRLLSSLFAHGGLSHLAMNCLSLSNVGPQVERIFGPAKFLSIYLGAGILANTATFLGGSAPYSLGASGCTFGLLGALGGYYYLNRDVFGRRSQSVLDSIKRSLFINLFYGLSTPSIDHWAHAAGFVAGVGTSLMLAPRLQSRHSSSYRWQRTMRHVPKVTSRLQLEDGTVDWENGWQSRWPISLLSKRFKVRDTEDGEYGDLRDV